MISQHKHFRKLYEMSNDLLLVCRPTLNSTWGDRCLFLDEKYNHEKSYNHRSILPSEVVIEFDDEDVNKNLLFAEAVINNLRRDKIKFSLWFSGNKSYHIHFFVNTMNAKNLRLLKVVVMRYYSEGLEALPDLRLADNNHLIRAEYGVHEKTQKAKSLIKKTVHSTTINELSQGVWCVYANKMQANIKRRVSSDLKSLDSCECLKYLMDVSRFRQGEDGRERALLVLIHALKKKYDEKELISYAKDWYRYSGGFKLSEEQIAGKVRYQLRRDYNVDSLLVRLMEELGLEELMSSCPVHGKREKL